MRHAFLSLTRLQRTAGCALVLLLMGGCVRPPIAAAVISPIPAGSARVWFYRDYEPSVSRNLAAVALNGTPAGYVQPDGSAFYRDVPPGRYHVTVESVGTDANQAKDVELPAGQEAYVKVLALSAWESGGDLTGFQRDTFYVALVAPQVARAELADRPRGGG